MSDVIRKLIASWAEPEGQAYTTEELLLWIQQRNAEIKVDIKKIPLKDDSVWKYIESEGIIANPARSFFSISGFEWGSIQQPMLIQDEIGYLGILAKEINGVIHFLMQAKIEPGNINHIQISPTVQATKSNFTQQHGGSKPAYLEYFLHAEKYQMIVDQIQSEQASRFIGKRNRNILILVGPEEEIPVLPNYRFMTLGQIHQLMNYENLVNMDTRTILSCIPFYLAAPASVQGYFQDKTFYRSLFQGDGKNHLPEIYRFINNARMFPLHTPRKIPLYSMKHWRFEKDAFVCTNGYSFQVIFCDISIEGREVRHWTQPLFEAMGMATFGLLCCEVGGILRFLVKCQTEPGNFDGPELGPTVQLEAGEAPKNEMDRFFLDCYFKKKWIQKDVVLSEEGGRFYHEQNHNILLRVPGKELPPLPPGYFLVDYKTLNMLVQINNTLNIQLRNLTSLLEVSPCQTFELA